MNLSDAKNKSHTKNSTIKEVVHFQRTAAYCFPRNQTNCGPVFKTIIDIYPFGILYRWISLGCNQTGLFKPIEI